MITREIVLNCPLGLTVDPAGMLCSEAVNFASSISIEYEGGIANAKSMLNILGASLRHGEKLRIVCEGEDEEAAAEKIASILETAFV